MINETARRAIIMRMISRADNALEASLLLRAMMAGWDPTKKEYTDHPIIQTPGSPSPYVSGNVGPRTLARIDAVAKALREWMPVPAF